MGAPSVRSHSTCARSGPAAPAPVHVHSHSVLRGAARCHQVEKRGSGREEQTASRESRTQRGTPLLGFQMGGPAFGGGASRGTVPPLRATRGAPPTAHPQPHGPGAPARLRRQRPPCPWAFLVQVTRDETPDSCHPEPHGGSPEGTRWERREGCLWLEPVPPVPASTPAPAPTCAGACGRQPASWPETRLLTPVVGGGSRWETRAQARGRSCHTHLCWPARKAARPHLQAGPPTL